MRGGHGTAPRSIDNTRRYEDAAASCPGHPWPRRGNDAFYRAEENRAKLMTGEVVQMAPIGNRHAAYGWDLSERMQEWTGGKPTPTTTKPPSPPDFPVAPVP